MMEISLNTSEVNGSWMICFKKMSDFITLVEMAIIFRIVGSDDSHAGGKGPLGLSNPKPCSKQFQLKQEVHSVSG